VQRSLVMTLIGPDRPGLVESIAALVIRHEGNWLESRMSRLGGQFAGILRVEVPTANEPSLIQALKQLESGGLKLVLAPEGAPRETPVGHLSVVDIVGQDRPGIVREITATLARHGVNVEELETGCESAAMSGETLFHAHATLSIPGSCNTTALRQELEKIAADLIVEISLADLPQTPAGR
jgi:glycine cleavage system regulatory protein